MTPRPPLAAVLILVGSLPAAALSGITWMPQAALNRTFSGQTIEGHYADGGKFVESYAVDGRVAYQDERRHQVGHWSIQSDAFCTIYDADPSGGCFRVHKVSDNCFEFYFSARTEAEAQDRPSDKPSWTARGWIKGAASTCSDDVGV